LQPSRIRAVVELPNEQRHRCRQARHRTPARVRRRPAGPQPVHIRRRDLQQGPGVPPADQRCREPARDLERLARPL